MPHEPHERRFHGDPDRLRAPERLELLELERVVDLSLEGLKADAMLDVGTGSGVFAEAFAARGMHVSGIDVNLELLALAHDFVPEGEFKPAPAENIPYRDAAFDLAFLGHVLHEADDPIQALKEAARVASARVVVLEWPYREQPHGPPLEHRLKTAKVHELARAAGLNSVELIALTHMDLYRMTPAAPTSDAASR
jgi:ubiquinone/menaquinone biosynthesis C-methylase UbiE